MRSSSYVRPVASAVIAALLVSPPGACPAAQHFRVDAYAPLLALR